MKIEFSSKTKFLLLLFTLFGGSSNGQSQFILKSTAFQEGKPVPAKYTCDGANNSPQLTWTGYPAQTKSFALVMDDPDAPMGTWVHWVVYDIPVAVNTLSESVNLKEVQAVSGVNSWEEKGYNGPCPPGGTHRYIFRLFALDAVLNLKEGLNKEELMDAMKNHIIGETTLTGLFRIE